MTQCALTMICLLASLTTDQVKLTDRMRRVLTLLTDVICLEVGEEVLRTRLQLMKHVIRDGDEAVTATRALAVHLDQHIGKAVRLVVGGEAFASVHSTVTSRSQDDHGIWSTSDVECIGKTILTNLYKRRHLPPQTPSKKKPSIRSVLMSLS